MKISDTFFILRKSPETTNWIRTEPKKTRTFHHREKKTGTTKLDFGSCRSLDDESGKSHRPSSDETSSRLESETGADAAAAVKESTLQNVFSVPFNEN